jgi:CRP-like cAMP-binding protein
MSEKRVHDRLVFYPGDLVFAEGDEGNFAYLVQSGKIEIFKHRKDGSEHSLAILAAGRLFGEMALIDSAPRMASARAIEQTTLVIVSNEVLQNSLYKAHPLIKELIRNMANNLRSITRQHIEKSASPEPIREEPRPYVGKLL